MKNKILLIDDDRIPREEWQRGLQEVIATQGDDFAVEVVDDEEFKKAIGDLEGRQRMARDNKRVDFAELEPCLIDGAAVLIVDYDLLRFEGVGGIATGERIAYLARCYSTCGIIVALNQYGDNRFDLTLRGDFDSFADLNIGGSQLVNENLWHSQSPVGYRPWSWFSILDAYSRLETNVIELEKGLLDKPILHALGFPESVITYLPRKTEEFLATPKRIDEVTFREFVLEGLHGYRPKDQDLNDESLHRVAAARVSKWLERGVLPGQDILVDGPHLVSRLPSLLRTVESTALEEWNRTTDPQEENLGIKHELIAGHRFQSSNWLSRPAWFWQQLTGSEDVPEIADPFSAFAETDFPNFVFCEDISRFRPQDEAREFIADVPGPFARRYVANPATSAVYQEVLSEISYEPALRFALI